MDGDSVIAAEWSENIAEALETLGQDILQIDIKRVDDDTREINIGWKMKGDEGCFFFKILYTVFYLLIHLWLRRVGAICLNKHYTTFFPDFQVYLIKNCTLHKFFSAFLSNLHSIFT